MVTTGSVGGCTHQPAMGMGDATKEAVIRVTKQLALERSLQLLGSLWSAQVSFVAG